MFRCFCEVAGADNQNPVTRRDDFLTAIPPNNLPGRLSTPITPSALCRLPLRPLIVASLAYSAQVTPVVGTSLGHWYDVVSCDAGPCPAYPADWLLPQDHAAVAKVLTLVTLKPRAPSPWYLPVSGTSALMHR